VADVQVTGRSGAIRLLKGTPRLREQHRQGVELLRLTPAGYEAQMERTLADVVERARRAPMYAARREALSSIRRLEDLQVPFFTSTDLLPSAGRDADWSRYVDDEPIVAAPGTSGTSGRPRRMPYSARAFAHNALSVAPFVGAAALAHPVARRPAALALSAPEGYVTWHVMPRLFMDMGYDVVHVPFGSVVNHPEVAQDLVDHLLSPDARIDVIVALAPMVGVLLASLRQCDRGALAVEKLAEHLGYLVSGGTEVTPAHAAAACAELDLQPGDIVDLFASTECGVMLGGSARDGDFASGLQFVVPTLIPLGELERESAEPGYVPRPVLSTSAPAGTLGELAVTVNQAVPWINFRTGDMFEVAGPREGWAGFTAPRLRLRARLSALQDLAGAKIWPQCYQAAFEHLGGGARDYLAMAMKPGEGTRAGANPLCDKLTYLYEGPAELDQVQRALFEKVHNLDVLVRGFHSVELEITRVKDGTLARYRQQRAAQSGGAPGPLKHRILKGAQYPVMPEDVCLTRLL